SEHAGFLQRGVVHDVVRIDGRDGGRNEGRSAAEQLAGDQRGADDSSSTDDRLPKYYRQKCFVPERHRGKKRRIQRNSKRGRRLPVEGNALPGGNIASKIDEERVAVLPEVRVARKPANRKSQDECQGGNRQQHPAHWRYSHRSRRPGGGAAIAKDVSTRAVSLPLAAS